MKNYQQMTPTPRASGLWQIRKPFQILPDVEYTCIAIRRFQDLYNDGLDPLDIYKRAGIDEGMTVDGSIFSIRTEDKKGVNIVSISNAAGNVVHIPDNFIISFPNNSAFDYQHVILSCSLGPLPSMVDTSMAETAVQETVKNYFGVDSEVKVVRVPSTKTPTYEQHLLMEQARINNINFDTSAESTIARLEEEKRVLEMQMNTLTQILIDNNLLNKG